MDAIRLKDQGIIIPGKSYVQCIKGLTYKVIRFEYVLGCWQMFIEFPDEEKQHIGINDVRLRNMRLELVPEKGITHEDWIDPA